MRHIFAMTCACESDVVGISKMCESDESPVGEATQICTVLPSVRTATTAPFIVIVSMIILLSLPAFADRYNIPSRVLAPELASTPIARKLKAALATPPLAYSKVRYWHFFGATPA